MKSSIQIVANDADIKSDGSEWKPIWRHDTELGHDKALSVQEGRAEAAKYCIDGQIPLIVFIGDGVSDLPAAREADVLFARKGLRLEEYCKENDISYIPFETFTDIKQNMELIMKEDQETTQGQGTPARFNPRANMWRRISSQQSVRPKPWNTLVTSANYLHQVPQFIAATPSDVPLAGKLYGVPPQGNSGGRSRLRSLWEPNGGERNYVMQASW